MNLDELIQKIKNNKKHHFLYHFTDEVNLPSISNHGLLSKKYMRSKNLWPLATGGNTLSHDLDKIRDIDSYVSLCMTRDHSMEYMAKKDGRLHNSVYLAISPEVLKIKETLVAFGIANSNNVEILPIEDAIMKLDTEVIYDYTDWSDPLIQQRLRAAKKIEILVKNCVPLGLIAGFFNGNPSCLLSQFK